MSNTSDLTTINIEDSKYLNDMMENLKSKLTNSTTDQRLFKLTNEIKEMYQTLETGPMESDGDTIKVTDDRSDVRDYTIQKNIDEITKLSDKLQ